MKRFAIACLLAAGTIALAGCGGDEGAPATATEATPTEPAPTTETETTATVPPQVRFTIVIRDGAPVGGIARPKVDRNDSVVLVVRSDEEAAVHLHGYDLDAVARPGRPARMRFEATIPGRFEIELHAHPEIQIGELTVGA